MKKSGQLSKPVSEEERVKIGECCSRAVPEGKPLTKNRVVTREEQRRRDAWRGKREVGMEERGARRKEQGISDLEWACEAWGELMSGYE